jgi:AmmeMemoRadiSam system protein A
MNQVKDDCIKIARLALEEYLKSGRTINAPDDCPRELIQKKAGVFVSFHKSDELRGCIGTFLPTQSCIGDEIIACAIAASRDPRFLPLRPDELEKIKIKVDILSPPKKSKDENLDPKKYGVIVKARDGRRGLLLPDLEGVDTVKQQIEICRQKAGISPNEEVELYRFTVERHE